MYSTLLPNHVHTHPHTYTKFSTLLIDQKHQEGPEVGLQDSGKYSTIRREHILCLQDSGKYSALSLNHIHTYLYRREHILCQERGKYSALSLNHIHTYLYTYTMHSTPGSGGSEPARQRMCSLLIGTIQCIAHLEVAEVSLQDSGCLIRQLVLPLWFECGLSVRCIALGFGFICV
jgi:hypothetical protein